MTGPGSRLIAVEIDPASLRPTGPFDRDRTVAVTDLLAENTFSVSGRTGDAFRLRLSLSEGKLVLDIADGEGAPVVRHILSLTPLRRVVKDYFLICDAYRAAANQPGSAHLEAIDVGRRGLHNEGAEILRDRLTNKIAVDFQTARRLFTLVCALHWKG